MSKMISRLGVMAVLLTVLGAVEFIGSGSLVAAPWKKHKKKETVAANDPTARLFQFLDDSMGGKLDLYLLADVYSDPSSPQQQFQRVLHVLYDKSLYFGRFTIHVRSVGKLDAEQLSTYTPQQIFDFGVRDTREFEKINPGSFGGTGDLFLSASANGPLAATPITDSVQQRYDLLVTKYILPAVKKEAPGAAK